VRAVNSRPRTHPCACAPRAHLSISKLIRAQLAHPSKDRRELSRARARKEVVVAKHRREAPRSTTPIHT
jgi:hypothetical protein